MDETQKNVSKMIEIVANYSIDTKFTIADLVNTTNESDEFPNSNDMFEITKQFLEKCQQGNIIIENTQAGEILGMPWAYTYIKK